MSKIGTKIGIIGGGQLGRMVCQANRTEKIYLLDPDSEICQGINGAEVIKGNLHDGDAIERLADMTDVLTYEIENINADKLIELEERGKKIIPYPKVLKTIQNKGEQKRFFSSNNIPVAPFTIFNGMDELRAHIEDRNRYDRVVIKKCVGGYDGKGVLITTVGDIQEEHIDLFEGESLLEEYIDCIEVSCMVAVGDGIQVYEPVEMVFTKDNVLDYQVCPAIISKETRDKIMNLANSVADILRSPGLFAIEMFLTKDREILVNEISPRPHNSGHHTIEMDLTSQFQQFLNILTGRPMGFCVMKNPSVMFNLLGPEDFTGEYQLTHNDLDGNIHLYGKKESRPGRKLGHVTIPHMDLLSHENTESLVMRAREKIEIQPADNYQWIGGPQVGVIMGSISDMKVMQEAMDTLMKFRIPHEVRVVSAHRTPKEMYKYAESARERGLKVIIAGAGGAAHLPGMTASLTTLPVIGVPVKTSTFTGEDSLLSIVQMPRGIPVATMAINGSKNAAILAARILSIYDNRIKYELDGYHNEMEQDVAKMNNK